MPRRTIPKSTKRAKPVPVRIVTDTSPRPYREKPDPRYDLDTLKRAEEIRSDPKRHAACKAEVAKEQAALARIAGKRNGQR